MKKKSLILILALAGLFTACTYPFHADIVSANDIFVVEGDINIGAVSKFTLSNAMALEDTYAARPEASLWVEGEDGSKYSADKESPKGTFYVDLTDAPDNCRYRLCISRTDKERMYYSYWDDVHMPPVIDSVTFRVNGNSALKTAELLLSFHSDDDEKYFRWSYVEDWEYRAPIEATHYYVRPTLSDREIKDILSNNAKQKIPSQVYGQVLPFDSRHPSTYYCWNSDESKRILLATTEDLARNRIVEKQFESIYSTSTKVNYHYRTKISIQSIGRDGYQYWNNLINNSQNTGNLDSPVPSQMPGNIYCEDDPKELVVGYVNVARVLQHTAHLNFASCYFITYPDLMSVNAPVCKMEDWYSAWKDGMLPYTIMGYEGGSTPLYGWAENRCVDCNHWGGSNSNRPSDWPDKWPEK